MEFQLASENELEAVLQLYHAVIGKPYCVWDENYPGWQDITEDYENGNLFVMKDRDRIVGAISIILHNELDELDFWKEAHALELARVVVSPDYQGQGIAASMVQRIEPVIKSRGYSAIHLLAAEANLPAQAVYRKCGFAFLGKCFMFGHDYIGCEKLL